MSTKVDSISGKCKVNISVDCPCKLSVQGQEIYAVPGDLVTLEQQNPSSPAAFFIDIKDISSVLSRVIALRRDSSVYLESLLDLSTSESESDFVRRCSAIGYSFCKELIAGLDEIIKDYSL